jgi:NADP-reducing hydrogenase subunit HndB
MATIKTLEDLRRIKSEVQSRMELRERGDIQEQLVQIRVAMATCGIASGAKNVMDYLLTELEKRNIAAVVTQTGCMGYCYAEPTIEVTIPGKEPIVFGYVDIKKADQVIEKFIKNGELVDGIIPVNYESLEGK